MQLSSQSKFHVKIKFDVFSRCYSSTSSRKLTVPLFFFIDILCFINCWALMAFFSHKNLLLFVKLKKINALFNRLFIKCNKLYKTCIAETSLVSFSIKKEEKKAKLKNSEAFCLKSWKFYWLNYLCTIASNIGLWFDSLAG